MNEDARQGEARLGQAIGAMTIASGAGLVVAPRLVLAALGARRRDPAPFFVQVVGMFMMTSGGLLADGCRRDPPSPVALRWAFAQKVGATVAMVLGVRSRRVGRQALAVAAIDGFSAAVVGRLLLARRG